MKSYYTGERARSYNQAWKAFSEKTLTEACAMIDLAQLQAIVRAGGPNPRILDVACGTGLLLQRLALLSPQAELYGIDGSSAMLSQARLLLESHPHVYLNQALLTGATIEELPYEVATFDLITCTNALHYLDDPVALFRKLAQLLAPQGQLIIEDYTRRTFPFPWPLFEWCIKRLDPQHICAYTLVEAEVFARAAGLQIVTVHTFPIDLLWHGWVIVSKQ